MYHRKMTILFLIAAVAIAGIFLQLMRKQRDLAREAASLRLEGIRVRRHVERLEMVFKQTEPALLPQIKARSDMEWQQAVKGLDEGELPTLYPLETKFTPIDSRAGVE
jgi:hypothetical protein